MKKKRLPAVTCSGLQALTRKHSEGVAQLVEPGVAGSSPAAFHSTLHGVASLPRGLVMKSARLLLVLFCLLIAMTVPAVAYAPTNGAALGSTSVEIKINAKEEVAALFTVGESSTFSVVPIPADSIHFLMFACMGFYGLALYVARDNKTERWRADRDYQSRFG